MRTLFYSLSDELLTIAGPAESVAGELIRSINTIGYQFYNNGNTVSRHKSLNNSHHYVIDTPEELSSTTDEEAVNYLIDQIKPLEWVYSEKNYTNLVEEIIVKIAEFVDNHPELKEMKNEKDSISYKRQPNPEDDYQEAK